MITVLMMIARSQNPDDLVYRQNIMSIENVSIKLSIMSVVTMSDSDDKPDVKEQCQYDVRKTV